MHPDEFYQSILMQVNDELERRVFEVLSAHVGEQVTRADLIEAVYGPDQYTGNLAMNGHDRAIRKCIEHLSEKDFPIVSTSGDSGYCLTDDPAAIDRCVAENLSRQKHLEARIDHLRRSKKLAQDLRRWRQGAHLPVQARMF